jgi:hypothetical protein
MMFWRSFAKQIETARHDAESSFRNHKVTATKACAVQLRMPHALKKMEGLLGLQGAGGRRIPPAEVIGNQNPVITSPLLLATAPNPTEVIVC